MSGEKFSILFNSQGSNVVDNSNLNQVVYNVNWGSLLPKKYKRFHCNYIFKSINYNGALLISNGLVSMNLGKVNVYDGNSQSYNLGVVYPIIQSSSNSVIGTGLAYQVGTTLTVSTVNSGGLTLGSTVSLNGNSYVITSFLTGTGLTGNYTLSGSQNIGNAGAPIAFYATGSNTTSYNSTNNDNNDFYIDYPSNNQITLNLRQFDTTTPLLTGAGVINTPSKLLHYVLYLSLEGVNEIE